MLSFLHGPYSKDDTQKGKKGESIFGDPVENIFKVNNENCTTNLNKSINNEQLNQIKPTDYASIIKKKESFSLSEEKLCKMKVMAKRRAKSFNFVHNGDCLLEPPLLDGSDIEFMKKKPNYQLIREIDPYDKIKRDLSANSAYYNALQDEKRSIKPFSDPNQDQANTTKASNNPFPSNRSSFNYCFREKRRSSNAITLENLIEEFNISYRQSCDGYSPATSIDTNSMDTDTSLDIEIKNSNLDGIHKSEKREITVISTEDKEQEEENSTSTDSEPLSILVYHDFGDQNTNSVDVDSKNIFNNENPMISPPLRYRKDKERRRSLPNFSVYKPIKAQEYISKNDNDGILKGHIDILIPRKDSDVMQKRLSKVSLLRRSLPCLPTSPTDFLQKDDDPCIALEIQKNCHCECSICDCSDNSPTDPHLFNDN